MKIGPPMSKFPILCDQEPILFLNLSDETEHTFYCAALNGRQVEEWQEGQITEWFDLIISTYKIP